MLEYEHTEDLIYFNKAEGIKQSWMKYYNKNEMTLYDYTNANRIQVLIYFICLSQRIQLKVEENR